LVALHVQEKVVHLFLKTRALQPMTTLPIDISP